MKKQNVFLCGIALTIGAWMYLVSFNVINTDNNQKLN